MNWKTLQDLRKEEKIPARTISDAFRDGKTLPDGRRVLCETINGKKMWRIFAAEEFRYSQDPDDHLKMVENQTNVEEGTEVNSDTLTDDDNHEIETLNTFEADIELEAFDMGATKNDKSSCDCGSQWCDLCLPAPEPSEEIDFAFETGKEEPEAGKETKSLEDIFGAPTEVKRITIKIERRVHRFLPECEIANFWPVESGSDEWLELRKKGVGSSDAGAILGVSKFSTARQIWANKIGIDYDRKPWLEPYANFGTWFESYLREFCEDEFGIEILDGAELGTLRWNMWPQAQANIDGLSNGVIEEFKTSSEDWDEVPEAYFAQVQHQMMVTGCDESRIRQFVCPVERRHVMLLLRMEVPTEIIANWLLEIGKVVTWVVERNQDYIDKLLEKEKAFWFQVVNRIEPDEDEEEGTVDLSEEFSVLAPMAEFATLWRYNKTFDQSIKDAKLQKDLVRKAITRAVSVLGETPKRVKIGNNKATLVRKGKTVFWQIYPAKTKGEEIEIDF